MLPAHTPLRCHMPARALMTRRGSGRPDNWLRAGAAGAAVHAPQHNTGSLRSADGRRKRARSGTRARPQPRQARPCGLLAAAAPRAAPTAARVRVWRVRGRTGQQQQGHSAQRTNASVTHHCIDGPRPIRRARAARLRENNRRHAARCPPAGAASARLRTQRERRGQHATATAGGGRMRRIERGARACVRDRVCVKNECAGQKQKAGGRRGALNGRAQIVSAWTARRVGRARHRQQARRAPAPARTKPRDTTARETHSRRRAAPRGRARRARV
jgi:hypothetical protein